MLAYSIWLLWLNGAGRRTANSHSMLAAVASSIETWESEREQGQPRGRFFGSVLVKINQLRGIGKQVTRGYLEGVLGPPDLVSTQNDHLIVVYFTNGIAPKSTAWIVAYDSNDILQDVGANNTNAFAPDFWKPFRTDPTSTMAPN
jgi:hypothetical protein